MNVGLMVAGIIVATLLFVGVVLFLSFGAMRRSAARALVRLQEEGIVLDSGPIHMKATFRGFRGPRVAIGAGMRAGPTRIVLTQRGLRFVPMGQNRFGFASTDRDLIGRFEVGAKDGKLHLHSDNPPNASGTVDILLSVSNPAEWVDALMQAGAQPQRS